MKEPNKVLEKLNNYAPIIDEEIRKTVKEQSNLPMYGMMEYFLGYRDEKLAELSKSYGGKRFRPGITLLLSDFYGTMQKAIGVAASIEVFHNFTLIHDDIEDNDPLRRGRPTVWKVWGTPQAINTGDAQLILSNIHLVEAVKKHKLDVNLINFLNRVYLQIAEGQFLDISMSEMEIGEQEITEEYYLEMIGKKSAYLIGASAKVAGMIAEKSQEEIEALWNYGFNLGLAYQICDDFLSIWGKEENTGKCEMIDIRDKKKTLPIIHLYQTAPEEVRVRLAELYNKSGYLSDAEVAEVKELLDACDSAVYVKEKLKSLVEIINKNVESLSFSKEQKEQLYALNNVLLSLEDAKC